MYQPFSQTKRKHTPESAIKVIDSDGYDELSRMLQEDKTLITASIWDRDNCDFIRLLDYAVIKNKHNIAILLVRMGATLYKKTLDKCRSQFTTDMREALKQVRFTKGDYPPRDPDSQYLGRINSIIDAIEKTYSGSAKDLELVKSYIEYDPNSLNDKHVNDTTALEHAVWHASAACVKLLLDEGACSTKEVFVYAAYSGYDANKNVEKLKILAQFGYAKELKICTKALLKAIENCVEAKTMIVVQHIFENHKIDWSYTEGYREPKQKIPQLALAQSLAALELCFKYGKDTAIDMISSDGWTLMHQIARGVKMRDEIEVLNLLFKYNANPCVRNFDTNMTAYQLARVNTRHDIAETIKEYTLKLQVAGKVNASDMIEVQDKQLKAAQSRNNPPPAFPAVLVTRFNEYSHLFIPAVDIALQEPPLGVGGFGKVYLANWQNNAVAVKMLKADYSADTLVEFFNEAILFHKLRHPNIVQMFGICDKEGIFAIVMEFMHNGNLFTLIHSGKKLSWEEKRRLAGDIAKGLAYLHSLDIMHRDLKSLNVLVSNTMTAKLCDFGLSRIKQESQRTATSTTQAVGTLPWMAPELFRKKPQYTFEADLYSLGMIMWELATNKIPWEETPPGVLMGMLLNGQREDPPPTDTPISMASLIKFCWSPEPNDRPKMRAIVECLEQNKEYVPQP